MDIQTLIEKVSLLDYAQQFIEMHEDGGEWFGVCPFHGDTDPSFSISPEKNPYVYWCFGCQATGNILTFIQKYHKVSFPRAVKMAADFAGIAEEVTTTGSNDALKIMKRFAPPKAQKEKFAEHIILARDYMSRYTFNIEMLEPWLDEGITIGEMERFEVCTDERDNRIAFPIKDGQGNIVAVSGRTCEKDYKSKGLRKYSYYQKIGQLDLLYGLYENKAFILEKREVIVVEGAKSVMKLASFGAKNAVAALTSHLNEYQMRILLKLGCSVVFAFDRGIDERADKNVKKLCQFCNVYYLPNKDKLLPEKASPADCGKEVWEQLYEGKRRIR